VLSIELVSVVVAVSSIGRVFNFVVCAELNCFAVEKRKEMIIKNVKMPPIIHG
jgi:hypothetical protein